MTAIQEEEYRALRATIRERGSARVWVFLIGLLVWAALLVASLALALPPAVALILLLVLAATFEAVVALHVAVERIGRYLFVFHDDQWERTAGMFGRPSGAIGVDPLFTAVFMAAAVLNVLPVVVAAAIVQEWAAIGLATGAFLIRVLVARAACSRQRAVDSERFTNLRGAP